MAIPATACYEPPTDAAEHAPALMGLSRGNAVRRPGCDAFLDGTWYRSEEILPHLRAGDIVTHIYHGGEDSLVDAQGRVREIFREAKARGVTFDVGLDRIHTNFAIVRAALVEGFFPHYLSTDLTMPNRHVTVDMPTTISKLVALGMPLEQAIAASGHSAAVKLGMDKVFGVIREGNQADLGIFELQDGAFVYHDTYGNTLQATKRLASLQTLYAGRILEAPRRSVKMYEFVTK